MKLILLGTTGYHPNDRRHTSCMMVPEAGLVLDAGTAMYRVSEHLCKDSLDILLSHAHLDHIVGLTFLLDVLYGKSMQHVRVHAERKKLEAIEQHLFAKDLFPVPPLYEAYPLEGNIQLPDGGLVSHFPLIHPAGSVGYRIDWPDRSLAYVTDTTASPEADYVEAIRGVDLLIHECYFPDGHEEFAQKTGHSCTTPVAQVAAKAGVGRLVLVHINPGALSDDPIGLATARAIFPQTEVGEDGLELEF